MVRVNCEHTFEEHVGIKVFAGAGIAWVRLRHVSTPLGRPFSPKAHRDAGMQVLTMQRCVHCGEPGYEVPAVSKRETTAWRRETTA